VRICASGRPSPDPAFLVHELDAQPGAPAVSPFRTPQRRKDARRGDPADTLKVVDQLPFLGGQLRGRRQMLQCTSAAHAEMGTARHDPVR